MTNLESKPNHLSQTCPFQCPPSMPRLCVLSRNRVHISFGATLSEVNSTAKGSTMSKVRLVLKAFLKDRHHAVRRGPERTPVPTAKVETMEPSVVQFALLMIALGPIYFVCTSTMCLQMLTVPNRKHCFARCLQRHCLLDKMRRRVNLYGGN